MRNSRLMRIFKGAGFPDGLKALVVAPLVAIFRIDEADRKVFVEAIRFKGFD